MTEELLKIQRHLPELLELEHLLEVGKKYLRVDIACQVEVDGLRVPVQVLELGSLANDAPVIGFFAGVHGVERIGTQVLLSWLHSLVHRLEWDESLHEQLQHLRLLLMPMINPGGIWHHRRSNLKGVDLMRNAPIDAMGPAPWLVSGHRISRHLPWYRGRRDQPMETEAMALVNTVRQRLLGRPFALSVDCHSGFGRRDRLWCSYARSHRPIPHIAEVHALKQLYQRSYPHHHPYIIEPQSVNYTTHGDLWDYLYDEALEQHPQQVYLPFTLEMGSWLWVRKNPRQMLDWFGYFNPVIDHRKRRVLRQHLPLFEFLSQATRAWQHWQPAATERERLTREAIQQWFI
ncbi:M14 family zinc carboxypeptidase [Halopseudomonas yangmingensis]|uniref:Zinc carboxypeptidase n=1 Tax=Halopseudomonas yangmingensis TaxID=1720063 RepID=A0A1I4S8L0_9GAMM|nr:M14 family zinc carboxypeptidase [Halopseudomonas yangmingensis]SFM60603.1 Zinc carboxypeptidase [Halopseudomonas yangmingensis]